MPKELKKVPDFKNEDEEREFWATHDSTDYVDWSKAHRPSAAFHNLKPSEDLIELQLPMDEIQSLDSLAKKHHVSRDALASKILREGIRREQGRQTA